MASVLVTMLAITVAIFMPYNVKANDKAQEYIPSDTFKVIDVDGKTVHYFPKHFEGKIQNGNFMDKVILKKEFSTYQLTVETQNRDHKFWSIRNPVCQNAEFRTCRHPLTIVYRFKPDGLQVYYARAADDVVHLLRRIPLDKAQIQFYAIMNEIHKQVVAQWKDEAKAKEKEAVKKRKELGEPIWAWLEDK